MEEEELDQDDELSVLPQLLLLDDSDVSESSQPPEVPGQPSLAPLLVELLFSLGHDVLSVAVEPHPLSLSMMLL